MFGQINDNMVPRNGFLVFYLHYSHMHRSGLFSHCINENGWLL